jgi:DNA ligase (NAD+)
MNKDIRTYLSKCRDAYFNGRPMVPDEVYDRLVDNINTDDVGSATDSRYKHPFPMYSLQKVFQDEDKAPDYGNEAVVTTTKLDGAAVSLTYMDGVFHQALTRGDGKAGLDITEKMRCIVPPMLDKYAFSGVRQVTGEVVAPKDIPNSRNYAAGALNLKDVQEFKKRDITFIAYGVQPTIGARWLEDMTFLNNWFKVISTSDWNEFPNDGVVFRVDRYSAFEKFGYTSHHPRGAYAYKTREAGVVTKLLDVEWNTGKSGVIAPTGVLEPINIGGATISRATLHNIAFIDEMMLEIGCSVEVIRSGEIIPKVVRRVD